MRFRSEDIDKLISQIKIEDVVGEFVELKRAGSNYKGLCPFHSDTNPSFMVSPRKNICKCFVCGAGGNAISFYSRYKQISFGEAVMELSRKYNIQIRSISTSPQYEEIHAREYALMEEALHYFTDTIFTNNGRVALDYLSNRKVTPKTITDNHIGFTTNSWSALGEYLSTKGYGDEEIEALGLIKSGDKGTYDVFRNRIIFPIYNSAGKVIGFGGRTIENNKEIAKYINSPDTPIFRKGYNLYGLERAQIIKKKNYAILMEGYMDVLSACTYGFDVALAPLGTALTEEQCDLLKRYTTNVLLSFDTDAAGKMATERAGIILKKKGFTVRVVSYKEAKDPDEFLKTFGKDAYLKAISESLEIFDFLYEYYSEDYDLTDMLAKNNFIKQFKPFFQGVDDKIQRLLYLDKLSKSLDIDVDTLEDVLVTNNKPAEDNRLTRAVATQIRETTTYNPAIIDQLEEDTLANVIANVDNYKYFMDKEINGTLTKKIFYFIQSLTEAEKPTNNNISNLISSCDTFTSEEETILNRIMIKAVAVPGNEDFNANTVGVYKSWFNKELKEEEGKKDTSNLLARAKISKLRSDILSITNINDLVSKHDEFMKDVVFRNNMED